MHSLTRRGTALAAGLVAAIATAGAPGRPARAQTSRVTGSVDLGAAVVTYDDFLRSAVASAVPAVRLETARTTLVARGALSRFESGNSALQGTLAGSAFSPEVWKLRGEVFGAVSTARYADTVAATNLYLLGRLHAASPNGGAWVGGARGFVSQRSLLFNDLVQLDLGAWARGREVLYTLTFTPTRIGALDFGDLVAGARWQGRRGELAGTVGTRFGDDAVLVRGAERWVEVQGTWWLGSRLAVVGGVGAFPADVVQGLPGGRYLSTALRLGARRPLTSDPALRAELTLPYELERLRRNARPGDFQVQVTPDGLRRLRLTLRSARLVELMADFTDWTPVPFAARGDGTWELELFISPGVHRVNVRVDGGPWLVPPGLSAARDEFGGEVGLLVVQ